VKKRNRLRRPSDFRRLLSRNRVFVGSTLVGFASPRAEGESLIGVGTSRRLRGAVARNRARRRLREAARTILLAPDSPLSGRGIAYDVVLIARPAAVEAPFDTLLAETRKLVERLATLPR
jgi:ribonuclease P protein component